MFSSSINYYYVLAISYATALLGWWTILKTSGSLFIHNQRNEVRKPWLQTGGILIAAILTILIGRLYVNGYLVPPMKAGSLNLSECLNQLLIYSPFPLFLLVTKQSAESSWLPSKKLAVRILIGFVLSLIAVLIFVMISQQRNVPEVIKDVYHPQNAHHLVQVFMEDFAIALLLSRLAVALGPRYFIIALIVVAVLFAGAHVPNSLDKGTPVSVLLLNLSIDAGLVVGVGLLLYKSKDFIWLWPIHFAMDMMQFYSGLDYN